MVRPSLAVALCWLATSAGAQSWNSVWSDSFGSGTYPNAQNWGYELGANGWGNGELQNYTNRLVNARIDTTSEGKLVIEARRDYYQNVEYSSARLLTVPTWTYGKFEVRAKIPSGRGTWPAIWMLPAAQSYGTAYWPDNGEIDIMEHVGYDPGRIHCTVHTKAYNHMLGNHPTNNTVVADPFGTYHTYTCEWQPHQIKLYVDGFTVLAWARQGGDWTRWPFNKPFSFRLNIAVGGSWGGAQGVDPNAFPTSMSIDSISVSKASSMPFGTAPVLPGTIEAENFDDGGEGFGYHDLDATNQSGQNWRGLGVDVGAVIPSEASRCIGWIGTDEWINYTFRSTGNWVGDLFFRVASIYNSRSFSVELDDKLISANVTVPNTGNWDAFKTVALPNVAISKGTHKLRILANNGDWNLNWIKFSAYKGGQPPVVGTPGIAPPPVRRLPR
ncbi:MAG: family 16 glycosylhydrolase [Armatimonadetes bacterium]|nr:family 16 glycosylhydrolase [Armatimonadota bacterium]